MDKKLQPQPHPCPSPGRRADGMTWIDRPFTFGLPIGMLPFYLERLEGAIFRLVAKVENIPEELLSSKLDGKWSIKENIGHLAEVDEIALKRIDEMVQGVPLLSPAIFQPRQDYNVQPIYEVLQYFSRNRIKNLERYARLTEDELMRSSLHPRLELQMTPVDLAFFDAEHDDHHLVRISEIIKTLRR
jgi:uncharacterized damage-inducible protein DinB